MKKSDAGKILVLDDEKATADAFQEILEDMGYTVEKSYAVEEALLKIENDNDFFLVVTDLRLGKKSGLNFIESAKKINSDLYFIIITAYGSITNAVDAMKLGISDYFTKPVDFEKFKIAVNNLSEKYLLLRENLYLKSKIHNYYSFENIIGKSRRMEEVFEVITKVAKTNATVLLRGESGTGKALIAREIHFNSPRCDFPLIEFNCAALPENLLESELFGHVKGAFTGAISDRKGRFEEAGEGTVFLDEIGDISTAIQAKLLRILQDKLFEPLGSNTSLKLHARIIASTNKDLEESVKNEEFREDLYYRLNVVPVYLPPLRERSEDIPLLCDYFIKKYCNENSIPVKKIDSETMNILISYSWPGNVRELENLIERLVILIDEPVIKKDDIYLLKKHIPHDIEPLKTGGLTLITEDYEKKIIKRTLISTNSNRSKAAELLNISLRQLQYKIKKYNL